jgi:hypothetical protein
MTMKLTLSLELLQIEEESDFRGSTPLDWSLNEVGAERLQESSFPLAGRGECLDEGQEIRFG